MRGGICGQLDRFEEREEGTRKKEGCHASMGSDPNQKAMNHVEREVGK
jgi:hypothetical protein